MITRRTFLITGGALGSGALVGLSTGSGGARATVGGSALASRRSADMPLALPPVVAFFDGQLWLDTSGASVAYRPPTAAPAVPAFTDEELVRARGYI